MLPTMRKFGLAYCDLPTMMWNVTVLLRPLTLNIDKRYTKRIPLIFYILSTVISIGYFYVYLVSIVWYVTVKYPETGDIITAMVVFSLGISSEIGTSKLVCMFLYRDVIMDLVEGYLHCDSLVPSGSRFANNILKTLRVVKKRAIIFWIVIISNGVAYCAKPLILPGRHLMEDSLIIYGLEPMYESPNYEIAYCVTVLGVIFTCYLPASITAFLIVITGYTEAQMLALSDELVHLWKDAQNSIYVKTHYMESDVVLNVQDRIESEKKRMNDYIKKELKIIIRRHAMNINLLQKVEHVFRGAIAAEFALLVVGLIAELLGGLENTYIEVPYALMQVAMDCLVGQRLMDASIVFEQSVYDSKWENFDNANMKTILLMLHNSQKTLTLSAGGITMLSFKSLMSVLKSIYSAYTALRSTL